VGCGALLLVGGILAIGPASRGYSAAALGNPGPGAADSARQTSTAMLSSGIGMLLVGSLLVFAGVRRRR
jgi:hypothetical protein